MKIVHVVVGAAELDSMNGVDVVVHHLAKEQTRAGHDVAVWGICGAGHVVRPSPFALHVFFMQRPRFFLSRELRNTLDALDPTTWVQLHSVFIPEFVQISRRLRKRGIRYGVSPHGAYAAESLKKSWLRKKIYFRLFERRLLRRGTLLHALGESEVAALRQLDVKAPVVVIPNGQDVPALTRVAENDVARRGPVFGFLGRLALRHKGLDRTIQAFAEYQRRGGAGELWIVGSGADRAQLEELVASEKAQAVRFFGAKFGDEKLSLLSSIDVFLHLSRWEGLPMACLEAAALGKPLFVTRETNLAASVDRWKCGVVAQEATIESLAACFSRLERLYSDGSLNVLGNNAAEMIATEFTWQRVANRFIEAWEVHQ